MSIKEELLRIFESLPVGFGFRPTEEELVYHYLKSKILGTESHEGIIPVIEAYKMDPWFIPGKLNHLSVFEFWDLSLSVFNKHECNSVKCVPFSSLCAESCSLFSEIQTDGPEYFFFTSLHKKFPNRNQVQRTTTAGYWAKTGPDREIKGEATEEVIGTKKTFVFKMRRGRGHADVNTSWVIHEYSACMDSAPTNVCYLSHPRKSP